LIHASLVPSSDGVGDAKKSAPVTRTRISAGSSAPPPSSGTATIALVMAPSSACASRTHQISDWLGDSTMSANRNPAPSGVSGIGFAASPVISTPDTSAIRYSRWSAKFAKTRPNPSAAGTGR
jgi:hypothetical protein